jgi:hypothetical protein
MWGYDLSIPGRMAGSMLCHVVGVEVCAVAMSWRSGHYRVHIAVENGPRCAFYSMVLGVKGRIAQDELKLPSSILVISKFLGTMTAAPTEQQQHVHISTPTEDAICLR